MTDNPYNEDGKPSRYPFDDVDFDTLASLLEHMENRYAPPGIGTGAVWCIRRLGQ